MVTGRGYATIFKIRPRSFPLENSTASTRPGYNFAFTLLILACHVLSIIRATPALDAEGELEVISVRPCFCWRYFVTGIVLVKFKFVCAIACMDVFMIVLLKRAMAWLYHIRLMCLNLVFDDLWMVLVVSFVRISLEPCVAGANASVTFWNVIRDMGHVCWDRIVVGVRL